MRLNSHLILVLLLASMPHLSDPVHGDAQDSASPEPTVSPPPEEVVPESAGAPSDWEPLFNGTDLTGWTPKITGHPLGADPLRTVRVEDGMIRIDYSGYEDAFAGRFCHLFHDQPFERYRLRVVYRFHGDQCPGGPGWAWRNSGVMLHCQAPRSMGLEQEFPVSIEAQFLGGDGTAARTTGNHCTPGTNVVMGGELRQQHCINSNSKTCHGDEWVTAEFEVDGSGSIRHYIDGRLVLEYEQPQLDPRAPEAVPLIRDGRLKLDRGWIALQGESHPIDFREVSIRRLP
ncbi:MAG: DUF1080 domain-containing protein [Planctomycetota bacterium]|nr:DUF1080 domain-containing protein [Planctomycetota bacterium]